MDIPDALLVIEKNKLRGGCEAQPRPHNTSNDYLKLRASWQIFRVKSSHEIANSANISRARFDTWEDITVSKSGQTTRERLVSVSLSVLRGLSLSMCSFGAFHAFVFLQWYFSRMVIIFLMKKGVFNGGIIFIFEKKYR